MANSVFIPTVAKFERDILTSLKLQESLRNIGYNPGLMLVMFNGIRGVTENREIQYQNLSKTFIDYKSLPLITMLANFPLREVDFLRNPDGSAEHVKRGIDFARDIPVNGRKIVTFHLETLVAKEEFAGKDENEWKKQFSNIIVPKLRIISEYSLEKNVEVKVETTPVPNFGDIKDDDKRLYEGSRLNELRSPFYLTSQWGFGQIKSCGLGICLDLCHNRTIYNAAETGDKENLLHKSDKEALKRRTLLQDVEALEKTDIVHLNDGLGSYDSNGQVFYEGVALGKGDIKSLPQIIRYLDSNEIGFVIEVNETDFNIRPNTKESIDYLARLKND